MIKTEWSWVDAVKVQICTDSWLMNRFYIFLYMYVLRSNISTKVTCSSGAVTLTKSQQEDQITAQEVVPSPSFRVSRFCPFEIKRYKLAQKGTLRSHMDLYLSIYLHIYIYIYIYICMYACMYINAYQSFVYVQVARCGTLCNVQMHVERS